MNILLGVSASIACYKACTIASRLSQGGLGVDVVLTSHAAKLISPQLFRALTDRPAIVDEFDAHEPWPMSHITLADRAELLLVAPATAAAIARFCQGAACDLLSTVELALREGVPRWIAPAMNPRMYTHPTVQENLSRLRERGWVVLDPQEGWMACGDRGVGRMMEPEDIAERVLGLCGSGDGE